MNLEPLYELIRRFEGLRLKPYLCPAGVPTIGYGSTFYEDGRKVSLKDKTISASRAEDILAATTDTYVKGALAMSPVLGNHPEKLCAIADFCYNLGISRYKASTLRRKVNAEDWEGAAREMDKWVWGGGRRLPGLIARRNAEKLLLVGSI